MAIDTNTQVTTAMTQQNKDKIINDLIAEVRALREAVTALENAGTVE